MGGFDTTGGNALNTYGTSDPMNGSIPIGTKIGTSDNSFSMSKLGEYGKVAGQLTQPIALGLNAYSTFFGQGRKSLIHICNY